MICWFISACELYISKILHRIYSHRKVQTLIHVNMNSPKVCTLVKKFLHILIVYIYLLVFKDMYSCTFHTFSVHVLPSIVINISFNDMQVVETNKNLNTAAFSNVKHVIYMYMMYTPLPQHDPMCLSTVYLVYSDIIAM